MASTGSDDYVVVTHINLNKQPLANTDLALYISYLSKGFHLDQNDVIRGMDAYKTEFRYELSREAVSEDEEEEEELTPSYNMFARRGGETPVRITTEDTRILEGGQYILHGIS